jgi:hypothetical protein
MRAIEGEQVLARIFLGKARDSHRGPLHRQVLDALRADGLAGATVLHGIAGFGHEHHLHTASIEVLSDSLPIVIEVIDTKERLDRVLSKLDELMVGGVVMTERAHVLRYGTRRLDTPQP